MRTMLLFCLCSALSEGHREEVHGNLGIGMYGSASVEELLGCRVRLTDADFDALVGNASALTVVGASGGRKPRFLVSLAMGSATASAWS